MATPIISSDLNVITDGGSCTVRPDEMLPTSITRPADAHHPDRFAERLGDAGDLEHDVGASRA